MESKYKFTSGKEPSDEQLKLLMTDVLTEVKIRSTIAHKKFQILQREQIKEAKERFRVRSRTK